MKPVPPINSTFMAGLSFQLAVRPRLSSVSPHGAYPKTQLSILSSSKGFVVSSAERCGLRQAPATLVDTPQAYERFRAVTSISILMRGSARPAEIIMAAGRTAPKYLRSTGQHWGKSAPFGRT
jgi:hypothetical protein